MLKVKLLAIDSGIWKDCDQKVRDTEVEAGYGQASGWISNYKDCVSHLNTKLCNGGIVVKGVCLSWAQSCGKDSTYALPNNMSHTPTKLLFLTSSYCIAIYPIY